MDKVYIKRLEVFAKHGVFSEENTLGQKFIISAVLHTDLRKAGLTDELCDCVNYGEVSRLIVKIVTENTYNLIETVAERLAREILLSWPSIRRVDITVEKPWAPLSLPLETVAVEISREWHEAYIALGSNMGDRRAYLDAAVKQLNEGDCRVTKVSDFIVTAPYGGVKQEDFLNGAVELHTLLSPRELLTRIWEIEQNAHRKRTVRWGPRTLDLDILLYDDKIVDEPELHIPHVEMHKRDFVLIPLAQIAPWKRHPLTAQTVEQMLKEKQSEMEKGR